jgi:hypothetical protein
LSWKCVGGDVVVGGFTAQNDVAHTSANQKGLKALGAQGLADLIGKCANIHSVIMRENGDRWEVGRFFLNATRDGQGFGDLRHDSQNERCNVVVLARVANEGIHIIHDTLKHSCSTL